METEKTTWLDLKKFINGLTEDQLNQQLVLEVVDYTTYRDIGFGVVEEDIYMYDDDVEDMGTLKILKECHEDDKDFDETKCTLITSKGSVYLYAD